MQMLLPTKLRQSFLRWLALGLLTSLLSACGYNEIQVKDEAVKAAWSEVVNQYQRRADLVPNLVNTVKGYATLSNAGAQTNHLDAKTRELIALAVAVTTRCDGCITVHVDAALKHGASREEIAEALGVAVSLNAGAALVYSARVMDAVAAHENA